MELTFQNNYSQTCLMVTSYKEPV